MINGDACDMDHCANDQYPWVLEVTVLTKENQLIQIIIYQGAIPSYCAVNALIIAYNKFECKKVQIANFANGMLKQNLKQYANNCGM